MTVGIFIFRPWAPASAAAPQPCRGPELVIDGPPPVQWIEALEVVRARMRKNDDLDRCAQLVLRPVSEDLMTARVVTSGGRQAERQVAKPQDLLPMVEALVALPPPSPLPAKRPDDREVPEFDEARTGAPLQRVGASAHPEFGGGTVGRLAGSPLYGSAGLAAFAQLAQGHWLIGVSTRWEAVGDLLTSASPAGFNMETFAIGVGFGWRTYLGSDLAFDAMVGPEILVENQDAEGSSDDLGGTEVDVRVDALLRISTPRNGRFRFFATGDVDGSPSRFNRTKQINKGMPTLPGWSGGLQIGIMWGAE